MLFRSALRLELWSDAFGAFLYADLLLNFDGWRHYALRLDCSDGLQVWNGTPQQVAASMTIWQVSGSWNGIPATFYLDNVRMVAEHATVSQPQLTITPLDQRLRLAWPSEFADFKLQSVSTLSGPWLPFAASVINTNCECSIMFDPTNGQRFLRLSRP